MTTTILGVILAWFVSGQKPEPSVLPSEQNPVYFEASVTRETLVVLKGIALEPGSWRKGALFCPVVGPHAWCKCLSVCLHRSQSQAPSRAFCGARQGVAAWLGLGRGVRECPQHLSPQFPSILARLGGPQVSLGPLQRTIDVIFIPQRGKEGRLPRNTYDSGLKGENEVDSEDMDRRNRLEPYD